jgi:hypothetical protein
LRLIAASLSLHQKRVKSHPSFRASGILRNPFYLNLGRVSTGEGKHMVRIQEARGPLVVITSVGGAEEQGRQWLDLQGLKSPLL